MPTTDQFWPNGARLAVSFSRMFEAGGQPISRAPGFIRKDEIAAWALEHREFTPVYERGAPTVTGLPGSAA